MEKAERFYDTMQFHVTGLSREKADRFIDLMKMEGIPMQIFGAKRNARDYRQWTYVSAHKEVMPETIANIEFACDLSMQPHLTLENIDVMGQVIREVMDYVVAE